MGGGSNAIGLLHPFWDDEEVRLVAVEAGGYGLHTHEHAASLAQGRPGIIHGSLSYVLDDEEGQICEAHSISAGLDYPGVGPELAHMMDIGRLEVDSATDDDALNAFEALTKAEGIIPALESSHALAAGMRIAADMSSDNIVLINLSGRGDKDLNTVMQKFGFDAGESL